MKGTNFWGPRKEFVLKIKIAKVLCTCSFEPNKNKFILRYGVSLYHLNLAVS
jgi:hypothetical protein